MPEEGVPVRLEVRALIRPRVVAVGDRPGRRPLANHVKVNAAARAEVVVDADHDRAIGEPSPRPASFPTYTRPRKRPSLRGPEPIVTYGKLSVTVRVDQVQRAAAINAAQDGGAHLVLEQHLLSRVHPVTTRSSPVAMRCSSSCRRSVLSSNRYLRRHVLQAQECQEAPPSVGLRLSCLRTPAPQHQMLSAM